MKKYSLIIMVFSVLGSGAQNLSNDSLIWKVSRAFNQANNETIFYTCHFETSPGLIKWIQKNGAMVYDFQVMEQAGSWPDIKTDGDALFKVTFRQQTGTIRVTRLGDKITVAMDITKDGSNMLPYKFFVTEIFKP